MKDAANAISVAQTGLPGSIAYKLDAESAVRAAAPIIAEAGYRQGVEDAKARIQGDFLGDDLSGEHSCHAGCPCHSGPEVHITDPGLFPVKNKRGSGE